MKNSNSNNKVSIGFRVLGFRVAERKGCTDRMTCEGSSAGCP